MMAVHSSVGKCYLFVFLAFVVFVSSEGELANESLFIIVQFVSLRQLLMLVRCTHLGIPIVFILDSLDPRDPVSTVCMWGHHLEPSFRNITIVITDGTPLRLTDSQLGSEQYNSSDYFVWNNETSGGHLLFIFPTRVNLTTITLHYYSDNIRGFGFPCMKFSAFPDDFKLWDRIGTSSEANIDAPWPVPPDGESTGPRSVSVNHVNITTKNILMYVVLLNLQRAALSEVEFFTCGGFASKHSFFCMPSYFIHFYQLDLTASTARTDPFSLIWLLMVIIVVNFVNGTFTIDDSVTGVYNKQADATDTSGNTSQYKTELQQ